MARNIFDMVIDTLTRSGMKLGIAIAVLYGVAEVLTVNTTVLEVIDSLSGVTTWLGLFIIVGFGFFFVAMTEGSEGRKKGRKR